MYTDGINTLVRNSFHPDEYLKIIADFRELTD